MTKQILLFTENGPGTDYSANGMIGHTYISRGPSKRMAAWSYFSIYYYYYPEYIACSIKRTWDFESYTPEVNLLHFWFYCAVLFCIMCQPILDCGELFLTINKQFKLLVGIIYICLLTKVWRSKSIEAHSHETKLPTKRLTMIGPHRCSKRQSFDVSSISNTAWSKQ